MRTGTSIAHYEVGELLGRGGMGEVYRALDTRLDRPVALKFLSARFVSDAEAKERFIREAKAASALDHPNICTIHDIGETDDGDLYIVMAFYEGVPLDGRIRDESFSVERTVHLIRQLALALKRAHEGGIVHRDVKPANAIVSSDDALRLLDFGVAKLQESDGLTKTGASIGTAGYMSPEQASGDPVSAASDVWSIGLIAYEMLAGERPFKASNPLAVVHQIISVDPTPLVELRPDVPEALAAVIHRALAKAPEDRYRDAAAFLDALDAATGTPLTSGAPGAVRSTGTRRGIPVVPIGVAVAIAAVASAVVFWPRGGEAPGAADADANVMAVFPFEVRGAPEFAYLAEGVPELVGDLLDGAGPIRTVDPRAVVGRLQESQGVLDAERAATVARELGAGRFVLGRVVVLPDRMTLSARTYEVNGSATEPTPVTFDGSPDSLSLLVDRLATGLLETALTGSNARIQRSATRSSSSAEATKAFLQGEQFHRQGAFDSAAAAYNRAIAADSTLALAHLMKSMNNAYTYETDDYAAAVQAFRFSDGLPERDRSLIKAFMDMQSGRLEEAEQEFLAHLKRWPDEVKAHLYLGILYQRSNPRWARPIEQARGPLSRALELEPGNVAALHRLARIDAGSGLYDSLPARVQMLERVAPASEWLIDAESLAAFTLGQTDKIEELIETFAEQSLLVRLYWAFNALRFGDDPLLPERMLARGQVGDVNTATGLPEAIDLDDELSVVISRTAALNGGRFDAIRAALTDPDRPRSPTWVVWDAELVVSDVVPVDRSILEMTLASLQAVDPLERLRNPFEPIHDVFTVEVMRLERDVSVAKLLGRLGRMDEAWALQRDIASRGPYEAFASLHRDAAGGVAADLHVLAGDSAQALEILRGLEYQLPMTATSLSVTTGTHARWLRAELERELGDPEVARYLYAGMVEGFSPPDKLFLTPAYERLGQIHDAAGRTEEAREYHRRFVRSWSHADEDLAPRVAAARARLEALGG